MVSFPQLLYYSGIIVDNIFKPAKALFSRAARALTGKAAKETAKTLGKKGIEAGVAKAGKNAGEKAGELIMKRLRGAPQAGARPTGQTKSQSQGQENSDAILNRLISGSGRSESWRCR